MDVRNEERCVLGIDPGTAKCGLAVVDEKGVCLHRAVVPVDQVEAELVHLADSYPLAVLVLGDKTGAADFQRKLRRLRSGSGRLAAMQWSMVDEHLSSVEGRRRYLQEHRRGWRRFVPIGLQVPGEPYDHYVAEVLARRYLAGTNGT